VYCMGSILSGNLFFSEGIANGLRQVNPPPPVASAGSRMPVDNRRAGSL
jgi:hypothetical protein